MKHKTTGKRRRTWKSLILKHHAFGLGFCVMQIIPNYLKNWKSPSPAYLVRFNYSIIMLHILGICTIFEYIQNYRIMIKEDSEKKSNVKFVLGLLPLVLFEIVSILISIFM